MSAVLDAPEAPAVCGANTGWRQLRLGHVAEFRGGMTPSKDERRYWDGDIPWVSAKDMKRPDISDSQDHVTTAALKETGLSLVQPGAILIVVRGMILAHTLPVAMVRAPLTINQDMKALVTRPGVQPEFLAWWLRGLSGRLLIEATDEAAHGTKAIRLDRLRAFPVALPATGEQRAIVAFLDRETAKLDALIAKKEQVLALLGEERTALTIAVITQGLDSTALLRDSGVDWLGGLPGHWQVVPLKHMTNLVNGAAFKPSDWSDAGVPIIRIENLNGGDSFNRTSEQVPERYHVHEGDLLFGWSGNRGTSFGPFRWARPGLHYLNQHIFRLTGFDCDRDWFYWVLKAATAYIEQQAHGIIGMVHVTRTELGNVPLPLPPHSEQVEIARYLDAESARIDRMIAAVRSGIEVLREYRAALITAAVTGQLDVRGRVPELEPAA